MLFDVDEFSKRPMDWDGLFGRQMDRSLSRLQPVFRENHEGENQTMSSMIEDDDDDDDIIHENQIATGEKAED